MILRKSFQGFIPKFYSQKGRHLLFYNSFLYTIYSSRILSKESCITKNRAKKEIINEQKKAIQYLYRYVSI